jgi:uncharacterized membrane protein YkoI
MDQRTENVLLKATVGVLVIATLAFGGYLVAAISTDNSVSSQSSQAITQAQAVAIASSVASGKLTEVNLENGRYEIEFEDGQTEIDVIVDLNGNVLKIEKEDELGRRDLELINPKFTEEQAKQIALAAVPGTITEFESVKVNNIYIYEIEIKDEFGQADVSVDMMTGQVVEIERETEDDDDDSPKISKSTSTPPTSPKPSTSTQSTSEKTSTASPTGTASPISQNEAEKIAINAVGGGSVIEVDFDTEGGKEVYEIEIEFNGDEFDVLVEIETGRVVAIEED